MARSISTTLKGSIHNYQVIAYFNNVLLGILNVGDHTFSYTENIEFSNASLTGNTPFTAHQVGTETTFTCTVTSYNKNTIKEAFSSIGAVSGGTATADGSPFTGAIEGKPDPRAIITSPLVVYPIFTDKEGIFGTAGTQYINNTSNPLALLLPEAVCTEGFELVFNSEAPTEFDLTFAGLPDVENGFRTFVQDDGIDTNGDYAP